MLPSLLLLAAACSDYQVWNEPDPASDGDADTDSDTDTDVEVPDTGSRPVTCADIDLTGWSWLASPPLSTISDPVDLAGIPFYWAQFSPDGWTSTVLPDQNTPVGFDRAFRAQFELPILPPGAVLDLASDDGIWIWLNGAPVGHWGGDFQDEGCVNDNADCLLTIPVAPIEITDFLVLGNNTIAGRGSNPVLNSWFEVTARCVDP